ncbi:LOW QUALITY PROTEIN: hypothetical protein Dda_6153 [Drechslerella dactyloides]|uniref:SNF7 family protein n=1 Tax=Drechslerella dactyloides TaxID=74499 RepID=A0AAD6NI75_DREDA|nr:LOW QUALITY PROTEIN: hypothetical protein Dda_6153 [Drechslerella dactyloides]
MSRLPSLYSDFTPLQTVNPDGYTANTAAWKAALAKASYAGLIPLSSSASTSQDRLILSITPALLPALTTREYGTPMGVGCAVNDAVAAGEMMPLKVFLSQEQSIYYKRWVDPWKVISWGLSQIGVGGGSGGGAAKAKLANGELVVVKNVEDVSRRVVKALGRSSAEMDRIMTLEMLEHGMGDLLQADGTRLSERDVKVIVKHLTRDLGEARVEGKVPSLTETLYPSFQKYSVLMNTTIKFKSPGGALSPISQSDITTAQLKHLIYTQHLKTDALSSKITALNTKARTAAAANNKITALSALKSKKMTEAHLQNILNNLSSLESVLSKIEQASDNVALLETLEQGSKVLAKLNKETGGIERVEKVMDELQERMEETDEVTRIVGEPGSIKMDEVEDDVQEELEKLLQEEKKLKEEEEAKALADKLNGLTVTDGPVAEKGQNVEGQAKREIADLKEADKRRDVEEPLPA